ncbi:restriction endonuclease subunit S [Fusibacter tunisiensis]|uniref:Type I restriction enzyme S subunit n=1 Tax=Fusibacter tunisiensis TaxID=1008308 RepID=A0ABS2MQ48_9FIRM|nr:restriction endonuclease subunit S [Fusibacter tunisiensis]MBM7561513.1 type I restriction enzyme S subunit [Fusibacter tunisiensis]
MGEWKTHLLGDICITNATSYSNKDGWEFVNYLDTGNITGNDIEEIQYINISEGKLPSRAKRKVKYNSIIYSTVRPNQLHYGIIKEQPDNFLVSTGFTVIDVNESIADADFLYYWLTQTTLTEQLHSIAEQSTSAYPSIKAADLEKLEIQLPSLDVQKKISSILVSLDKKRKNNDALNRNLLDQGRVLYEELISNYEVNAKLCDLISSIETGSRPKGGAQESGVPSIGAEKIESFGVYDYSGEKYINEEFFEKLKRGRVLSGDVLLYKDGAYTGKTSMALNDFPHAKCAINEHVYKLNSNENQYQFFLYFTLDNKKNRDYIYTLASSKAAQPGLNQTELLSVEIVMPDETALIEFEENVSQMMKMIASNAKENRKLTILRDSLLPKLMSGELDVSDLYI